MIPPVAPVPIVAQPVQSAPTAQLSLLQRKNQLNQWLSNSQIVATPMTSPDLKTTPAPQLIAQELPGGNSPAPTPPPPASIRDNGQGYPTRIPTNYVGPAIGFSGGNTAFGAVSRFPFGENLSIRPSATFGSRGTTLRVPVTFDFALGEPEPFEPNPLASFHAGGGIEFSSGGGTVQGDKFGLLGTLGVDLNLFEGTAVVVDFNTNFSSNSGLTVGLGFEF